MLRRAFWLTAFVALLSACSVTPSHANLYTALGGDVVMSRVVDRLIRNIAADERTRPYFRSVHIAGFRERLKVHFCDIADGPCTWEGRSMEQAHAGLQIESSAFNALVENLIEAMDAENIPLATQNRFLSRLTPMRDAVVRR